MGIKNKYTKAIIARKISAAFSATRSLLVPTVILGLTISPLLSLLQSVKENNIETGSFHGMLLNVAGELVAILLRTRKVQGSNIGPETL
jgi:hypothetical protein